MSEPNLSATDLGLTKLNDWMDKKFWTRPEGRVGKIFIAVLVLALAAGVITSLPAILSYILFVLQTTTQIVLHLGFLGTAWLVLTSKKVHTLIGAMFRTGIRKLTNVFVSMAPVAVARDIIKTSWSNIEKAAEAIKQFKVQMALILQEVANFSKRLEEQEAGAKILIRKGKREQAEGFQSAAEKTRMRLSNLKTMYQKMEIVCRTLEQMYAKAKIKLKNAEVDLEDQIRMRTTMMEGQKAIRKLKSAVLGSSSQNEMFDMAVTQIALDVANAVVEIDEFVSMGAELFESVDLEEAKFGERAIKQIEEWEKQSRSSVLGPGEKQALISAAYDPKQPYDLEQGQPKPIPVNSKFSVEDFFSN